MTVEGVVFDSVGVRFRGNTSYMGVQNSDKKSFAVNTDFVHDDQKIMGYEGLKFNNAHQDPSMMREVLYCLMAKKYTPIAKANYIHLFINQQDWGIYPNVQDVDKTFLKEWFQNNDGARFRATVENTGGGPGGGGGGGQWGDGTAGMNYLGTDTATYQKYYDLKSTDVEDPWQKLIDACQVLSVATANNKETVASKLDIDKILWFLAVENVFTDDDSYIMKGKMDYYVYYDPENDLTFPFEYDGNSSFETNAATSWSPFYNANKVNYPLLNKLLAIPEWRQRYLAHYRTILNETFTTANANAIIDSMNARIKTLVSADTKKLYSTTQYTNAIPGLKNFVTNRRNYLLGNAEIAQVAPVIANAIFSNSQSKEFIQPGPDEEVFVSAQVAGSPGISAVKLYYDNDLTGNFDVVLMTDDGLHHDGVAGDSYFGASIPGHSAGTLVRYYIEAIASNAALSASYLPAGAEHDVFVYTVKSGSAPNGVVVNEILASNTNGAVDEDGQFEDWIELYNNNDFEVDLSGYNLSDKVDELDKWQFPAGSIIPENGYLIVWADDDESDGPLHAGWKLSADGEGVFLSNTELSVVDSITFGLQTSDIAFARVPNGTGGFITQAPTFEENNETVSAIHPLSVNDILVYPNPAHQTVNVKITDEVMGMKYDVIDFLGRSLVKDVFTQEINTIQLNALEPGQYFIRIRGNRTLTMSLIKI
ncbi:MAG TPA: CotH kinase family protein [Saprospiraceae bacterium]|nr:CotH kinase family protein [Saprospiraceae bacterium]